MTALGKLEHREAHSLNLKLKRKPSSIDEGPKFGVADLYCGAGGLSLGAFFAARAIGGNAEYLLAADRDEEALQVFDLNFNPAQLFSDDIGLVADYQIVGEAQDAKFLYPPELISDDFERIKYVDLLVAGPPCQGHSNLNNHTRRDDPRNEHYLATVSTAIALSAQSIVIENVREVNAARGDIISSAVALFKASGYHVQVETLDASEIGIAQTRRRCFLVATKEPSPDIKDVFDSMRYGPTSCMEAIADLVYEYGIDIFNLTSNCTKETQERIDYLFEHSLYELPNHMRPNCHKNGNTYGSVYGRLKPDLPAGTLTQGFMTMGQGRFVHPTERRCLSAHEAARLQGFPDFFKFFGENEVVAQRTLLKLIGNAVPARLGEVACRVALSSILK